MIKLTARPGAARSRGVRSVQSSEREEEADGQTLRRNSEDERGRTFEVPHDFNPCEYCLVMLHRIIVRCSGRLRPPSSRVNFELGSYDCRKCN